MNKKSAILLVALLIFVIPVTSCAKKVAQRPPSAATNSEDRQRSATYSGFRNSDAWKKLDGRFKQAWDESMSKGDSRHVFECLIKTKATPTEGQKRELTAAGYAYRSIIGKILTGSVKAEDVPEVASLPFVQVMELAVPLSPKK